MRGTVLLLVCGMLLCSGLPYGEVRLTSAVSEENNRSSPGDACVGVVTRRYRLEVGSPFILSQA